MYWSKAFIPTLRQVPQEAESISHQLMLRAGLMRQLISGVYSYLPSGLMALSKIENIIRQEMNSAGARELLLPALQPQDLWVKSKRDEELGEVMFRFKDRRGRNLCLGPTHEEVITDLVANNVFSYKQLPLVLYQIQIKFRDEMRPRFGMVRSCEFIMKDAYSFDRDQAGLNKSYEIMLAAYKRIFTRCGLDFLVVEADAGVMGGSLSHEFMVPAQSGEDVVFHCPDCEFSSTKIKDQIPCPRCKKKLKKINSVEVGHIFQLGTKYSDILQAKILDENGSQTPIIMGCYGIGVSRLIPAILEQNYDKNGIVWPWQVSPHEVVVLPLEIDNEKIHQASVDIYASLKQQGYDVLYDDRNERAGVKFKDADLLGIPFQVILGKNFIKEQKVELKMRRSQESVLLKPEELAQTIKQRVFKDCGNSKA